MESRPRTPGTVYAVLSVVLILLVGLIAFTARQPPPPSIAEFAPQAIENITESPDDLGSKVGRGAGQPTPTTEPAGGVLTPEPIEVARVRKCIGDPPRQIEDPQSPPCVPYWSGNNGGSTWKGVSATSIGVVGTVTPASERILEGFFNSRFEFYGRKINLINGGTNNDCTAQKAQAASMNDGRGAFAVVDVNSNAARCLYTEMARLGLLGINAQQLVSEKPDMERLDPGLWQYDMGYDELLEGIGSMICGRLAGHPATHTTDGLLLGKARKFGAIVHYNHPSEPVDLEPLTRRMSRCGAKLEESASYYPDPNDSARLQTDTSSAVLKMKTENITTVICLCAIFTEATLGPTATGQGYFPEWVASSWGGNDYNLLIKAFWTPEQRVNMLGVTSHNRQVNESATPHMGAVREVDPSVNAVDVGAMFSQYRAVLLLASGIQMAGPHLTPKTFSDGLHKTRFPNPDHPTLPAKVGFLDGDHGMTNDLAEFWWSESEHGPDGYPNDGSVGALCYVDGGVRRSINAWPTDPDPFFRGDCISGAEAS